MYWYTKHCSGDRSEQGSVQLMQCVLCILNIVVGGGEVEVKQWTHAVNAVWRSEDLSVF